MDLDEIHSQLCTKLDKVTKQARTSYLDYFEQKYRRRGDRSDVIDLRTLTVVEDRGSLKRLKRREFGQLTTYSCPEGRKTARALKKVIIINKKYRKLNKANPFESDSEVLVEKVQAITLSKTADSNAASKLPSNLNPVVNMNRLPLLDASCVIIKDYSFLNITNNIRETRPSLFKEIAVPSRYSDWRTTDLNSLQAFASAKKLLKSLSEKSIQQQDYQDSDSTPVPIQENKVHRLPCPVRPKSIGWDVFRNFS